MSYAREMASKAIAAFTKGNESVHFNGEQYAGVEAVILEVIERCAEEAEDNSPDNAGSARAAARIRDLKARP